VVAWAALLAGIAGYVDAVAYLGLGHAFAANMTGNLVKIGIAAAEGDASQALWLFAIVLAYLLGVLPGRFLRTRGWQRPALILEAAMIAATAFGGLGLAATPLLAAAMALQNEAVRVTAFTGINIGFVTGDMQTLGTLLFAELMPGRRPEGGRKPRIITAILVCYALGAAIGALGTKFLVWPLLVPTAVLIAAAALPPRWRGLAPSAAETAKTE
jgi:uncharacterized membrane protein YoaK (UPF0700 family)